MDTPTANRLWKRAFVTAYRIDPRMEVAEDVAQCVILNYLIYEAKHGKISKQSIDQAVVDCLRKVNYSTRRHKVIMIGLDELEGWVSTG